MQLQKKSYDIGKLHTLTISFQLGCDDVLVDLVEVFFGCAGFLVFVEALAEDDVAAVDMLGWEYGMRAKFKSGN